MKTIKVNNLNFDIHDGPIGIALSGGADSAIMLYILMKFAPGPINVYTCANHYKKRRNPVIALRIIGELIDIIGRNDIYHHVHFTERQTFETLFNPLEEVIEKGDVKFLYAAGTSLPPDIVLNDKSIFSSDNGLYNQRNPNVIRPIYLGKTKQIYGPWWNQDKKFVRQVYEEFNMIDRLFPITRSCEDPELLEGHCGRCWWCEERKWAFSKL